MTKNKELRAIAVSCPDWVSGRKGEAALNSRDPVSLFNAVRLAAQTANLPHSAWGQSNWSLSESFSASSKRKHRRSKTLLMYSLDDMSVFENMLINERPNLLLLGAMTLSFPGAIACARRAREILGRDVFIVLGGRHVNETIFKCPLTSEVRHLPQSPIRLMEKGKIENIFDLCLSGDGEHIIVALGEAVGLNVSPYNYIEHNKDIAGEWVASWIDSHRTLKSLVSRGLPIDYSSMPSPSLMFGVNSSFDVFKGLKTAHLFSDIGRGCVYNCHFCSERRDVAGKPRMLETSYQRLYRQMAEALSVIKEDHYDQKGSGFVEDSVLLGGSQGLIKSFADYIENNPLDFYYGGQLTIDQILSRKEILVRLNQLGLSYLFIGLETFNPEEFGGMSKDVGYKKKSWVYRAEETFNFLNTVGIACGAAILFGLGESHKSRLILLEQVKIWQEKYGMPFPVSMNWAVQHPLCDEALAGNYDYTHWGTPEGSFLDIFHDFGEASLLYPIQKVLPPVLQELKEIHSYMKYLQSPINERN